MSRARRVIDGQPPSALSRRHAAGAFSARGLLLTVLGELVLAGGGRAWTSALIDLLGQLGIEEKTTRQAVMRTASDGWLVAQRIGRRTRWQLTPAALALLTEGARRIYSFAGPAQTWDGRWLLVSARVPESDRRARHIVRTRLSWAGFGSLAPGLWITPHPDREAEATQALHDAAVTESAHVFLAARAGLGDVRAMVREAWDLEAIDAEYGRFLDAFGTASRDHVLARQVALVHAWRRFPAIDPALPRELLPPQWSGVEAAALFARRHAEWASAAAAEWSALNPAGD